MVLSVVVFVRLFIKEGHQVDVIDDLSTGSIDNIKAYLNDNIF